MLAGNTKLIIIALIAISGVSYGLLFYFETLNEAEIHRSILEQQTQRQIQSVRSIATNIASDISSVTGRLKDLAIVKAGVYDEDINNTETSVGPSPTSSGLEFQPLFQYLFNQGFRDAKRVVDRLFVVDKSGIITESLAAPGQDRFIGANVSLRNYVKDTRSTKAPVFSNMFRGLDGFDRIVFTYPILMSMSSTGTEGDRSTDNFTTSSSVSSNRSNEYMGLIAASVPVKSLFEKYGLINNVGSQFLVVLDKNGTIMFTPRTQFIGKPFFGNEFQKFIFGNKVYNDIVRTVMSGRPGEGSYHFGNEDGFLNTGYPVFLGNYTTDHTTNLNNDNSTNTTQPHYLVFVVTPFDQIFSNFDELASEGRSQTLLLMFAITGAVSLVFFLFYRWYKDLGQEVQRKTARLTEANERLKILNEKLLANEQAKEEFVSMVSHELRTPLTPIKAFAEMLLKPKYMDQAILNEKQKKAVTSIVKNIGILEKLVLDVLDVYRIEMNRLRMSRQSEDLVEVVNCAMSNYKPLTDEKGIKFESDIRTSPGTKLYCDLDRISQVLGNLVRNSIDFVPSNGGRITIRAEEQIIKPELEKYNKYTQGRAANEESSSGNIEGSRKPQRVKSNYNNLQDLQEKKNSKNILFTVVDNGIGFPPDKIDHMFQKFYQIDTSLTRKHGGTGLGLVICKGIVEAHGGLMWIDKDYRQGASIKFTLPRITTEGTNDMPTTASVYSAHESASFSSSENLNKEEE